MRVTMGDSLIALCPPKPSTRGATSPALCGRFPILLHLRVSFSCESCSPEEQGHASPLPGTRASWSDAGSTAGNTSLACRRLLFEWPWAAQSATGLLPLLCGLGNRLVPSWVAKDARAAGQTENRNSQPSLPAEILLSQTSDLLKLKQD